MVHPHAPSGGMGAASSPDLNEEQLVVRASRGEGRGADGPLSRLGHDLAPAEHVAVELGRALTSRTYSTRWPSSRTVMRYATGRSGTRDAVARTTSP